VDRSDQAVAAFAERMRVLKTRSNRSYEALAHRVGIGRSTLHRYCRGVGVPSNFDVIARFAHVAGASEAEVDDLRRHWRHVVDPEPEPVARPPRRRFPVRLVLAALLGGAVVWFLTHSH
jgi:transcriptional regulator with XRE-family HTH domain